MDEPIPLTIDTSCADTVDATSGTPAAPEDPTELRLRLHRNGYRPIPVLGAHVAMKGAGKRPMMKGWETVCASAAEAEIARWTRAQRNCTNTGLLCGELVGVDIDVLDRDHAHRLTCIATEMLGMSTASRIGRAPKILLALRTDAPFDKVQTSEFHMLDASAEEVLKIEDPSLVASKMRELIESIPEARLSRLHQDIDQLLDAGASRPQILEELNRLLRLGTEFRGGSLTVEELTDACRYLMQRTDGE